MLKRPGPRPDRFGFRTRYGCPVRPAPLTRASVQHLPAGPPSRDAALVICAYVTGPDAAAALERLLLEALADIKCRGIAAIGEFRPVLGRAPPPA